MIHITSRPLTEAERKSLLPRFELGVVFGLVGAAWIVISPIVLGILYPPFSDVRAVDRVIGRAIDQAPWILAIVPLWFAPGFAAGYLVERMRWRRRWQQDPDLMDGMAETLTVDVRSAIVIEEDENEGRGAYLDIGEGKVLFLQSQDFYPEELRSQFRMTRTRLRHIPLDEEWKGTPLLPVHTNPPFTREDYERGWVPGEVFEADFVGLIKERTSKTKLTR